jgi:hypothetical protein
MFMIDRRPTQVKVPHPSNHQLCFLQYQTLNPNCKSAQDDQRGLRKAIKDTAASQVSLRLMAGWGL